MRTSAMSLIRTGTPCRVLTTTSPISSMVSRRPVDRTTFDPTRPDPGRDRTAQISPPPPQAPTATTKNPRSILTWKGRPFALWNARVYLPAGYEPEDPNAVTEEGYPKALVRDGVTFVRLGGRRFKMGAIDDPARADDGETSNRPAHWVDLPGFYIQKDEVTNGDKGGRRAA